MQLLYPNNIKKYIGTIKTTRNGYKVIISTKNLKIKSNFPEYNDAFEFLIQSNIMNDLPIKNIVEIRNQIYFMK